MEIKSSLLAILLLAIVLVTPTVDCYDKKVVQALCSKLPHPQPCEFFLTQKVTALNNSINLEANSLMVSLEVTLERAQLALTHTSSLGPKCSDPREKAAWEDCLDLYKHTVEQLNKTISSKCTDFEKQTWLSTALTNLDTCKTGFEELGLTANIYPMMSNNVPYLVSNALALNKGPNDTETKYKDGFPDWVKPGDRKLLASSTTANVVVAQDGSGNYKTVSQAVAAASGKTRFVIHVKAGTYNENVQIKSANVMLVGDGIGKTIITGSKSVGGSGSTTFQSATVGT